MNNDFFHPRPNRLPKIYGYTELTEDYSGLIRIGYTERDLYLRMQEHYPTAAPEGIERYKILFEDHLCVKMEHILRIIKFTRFLKKLVLREVV